MKKILEYDEVSSTNDICFDLIEKGEREGTAVVALSQTAGRGRQGRHWISPKNEGLYLSLIIKKPGPDHLPIVPLVLALAVLRCLKPYSNNASIKWPNDVLLGAKKAAGCLVESRKGLLVAGIGINLNNESGSFPENISATSVKAASKKTADPVDLRNNLIAEFEILLDRLENNGKQDIISEIKENCSTLGKKASFVREGHKIEALARDIDDLGGLIIERADGKIEVLYTGEITNGG